MANLTFSASFDPVYQYEDTDLLQGGAGAIDNIQAQALGNRTEWLKLQVLALQAGLIPSVAGAVQSGYIDPSTGLEALVSAPNTTSLQLNGATTPAILAFQDGYDTTAGSPSIGSEKVIYKYVDTNVPHSNFNLAISGTHTIYAQLVGGNVALNTTSRTIYVQPLAPAFDNDALWYNYATNKWYQGTPTQWLAVNVIILGEVAVAAGAITAGTLKNYPYGVPFFDRRRQAGEIYTNAGTANERPLGGWLFCDGTAVSRTRYARLFARIGTTYGAGDGSTTFNLPDLRAEFIRGWDAGRAVDTGRNFASTQADAFKSHFHIMKKYNRAIGTGAGFFAMDDQGTDGSENTEPTGGTETRPRNVALGFWIKF